MSLVLLLDIVKYTQAASSSHDKYSCQSTKYELIPRGGRLYPYSLFHPEWGVFFMEFSQYFK